MRSFEKLSGDDRIKIYSLLFLILSLPYIYFVVWRIGIPFEINGNEPWNAYHARYAFIPALLYPNTSEYINNYPPLSYYVIHLLSYSGLNEIIVGRALSLFSISILSLTIYFIGRFFVPNSYGAPLFGAIWFFVTMCRGFVGYAGMNDPHVFGLAVMAVGFWAFLKYRNSNAIFLSFFVMILAGFIKNSLFALPIASLVLMMIERNRRLVSVIIFSILVLSLFFIFFIFLYGQNFLNQLFIPREIKLERIIQSAQRLQWVVIPLAFWIFWIRRGSETAAKNLTLILVLSSAFIFFVTVTAEGVGTNAIFELVFSTAICISVSLSRLAAMKIRTLSAAQLLICLCALRTVITLHHDPYFLLFSANYKQDIERRLLILSTEVDQVMKDGGNSTCSIDTICFLAHKERSEIRKKIDVSSEFKWTIKQ